MSGCSRRYAVSWQVPVPLPYRSMTAWMLALVMTSFAARVGADNGEGFFTVNASNAMGSINIVVVDDTTLLPLPSTFTANDQGEYAMSGLVMIDEGDPQQLGRLTITGQGDPHLEMKWEVDTDDYDIAVNWGFPLFVSIIGGIEIVEVSPTEGMFNSIQSTQTIETTGDPGSPPFDAAANASVFLKTSDGKSTNAIEAQVGGAYQVPSFITRDSGIVDMPAIPIDSTQTTFNTLEVQHDFAFFEASDDGRLSLTGIIRTEILAADTPLPGDYNNDGVVNLADYPLWRDNLGAPAGTLPNDVDGGTIGTAQYDTWKANLGNTESTANSPAGSRVPEPATTVVVPVVLCCVAIRRRNVADYMLRLR